MTEGILADIEAVSQIPLIDNLLDVACKATGLGFAAVIHITDKRWVICEVKDNMGLGLLPGTELPLSDTIDSDSRQHKHTIIIDGVQANARYRNNPMLVKYGFRSCISVPILKKDGQFFGTLFAAGAQPAKLNQPQVISMFNLFAGQISDYLMASDRLNKSESNLVQEHQTSQLQRVYTDELSEANRKLGEANAKLQQAIDTGNMGTWSINPANQRVTMSSFIRNLSGLPLEGELTVEQTMSVIDPAYRDALTDVMTDALVNHKDCDIEYPLINALTGERKWVRCTGKLMNNHAGKTTEYSGILLDITSRKRDEDRQAMMAAIIESSEDAIVSKTLDGIITSWNRAAECILGYAEHEVIGKHISIIIPEDRLAEETQIISKIRNSEKVEHFETMRRAKSGAEIPLSLTISPIRNESGQVIGASKIARDISKQKIAEERLQNYAERMEILNSIGQAISADLDTKGILQKVTDATTQLTGAEFGAFFHNKTNEKGESYMLYTLSGAPREAFEKFPMQRNTKIFTPTFFGEGIVRSDDITKDARYGKNKPYKGMPGGHFPVVSYMAVPVTAKNGEVIGGLFFGHPTPGRFKKEHEQLVGGVAAQAAVALDNAKLYDEVKVLNAKKDEFIGLASHELKTPVTSISGYLQILERDLTESDRNKTFINKARAQVNKLTTLVEDLLDVSKIQTGKLPFSYIEFDLTNVLAEVTDMLQQNSNTHKIELHYNQTPINLRADQQRIEQVMINLVNNAIKYSPGANKVIINAELINKKVRVSVKDFGIGIAHDQQDRIFSRFYRVENLAAHMSGLGIGLYISHEIIERHDGKMWVVSELGKGSTFIFELPVG